VAGRVLWGSDGPHVVPDLLTFVREPLNQIRSLGLDPLLRGFLKALLRRSRPLHPRPPRGIVGNGSRG